MIASDKSKMTYAQPRSSGWYISVPSADGVRTVGVNGVSLEIGPENIPENVVNTLLRWMDEEYESGISPEELARKVAIAHGGMMCKAPKLTLNLHDETQYPALGAHESKAASKNKGASKPVDKYWFALDRKKRVKRGKQEASLRTLPPAYVSKFSDSSRGTDNNPNPELLKGYSARDLGIPEQDMDDFMQSGLGPKEYLACNRVLRHLKLRIDMARDRLRGDDFARETRDTAIDAALTTLFSTQVGLPVGFGDRLWSEFSSHMWHDNDTAPEDVISDCLSRGVLSDNVGSSAIELLRRVNPKLVWNYSGKITPAKAERRAENDVYKFATDLITKRREEPTSDEIKNFSHLKYPDSESSSSDSSDEETSREKESCHASSEPKKADNQSRDELSSEQTLDSIPKLEEIFDGYLAGMSDCSDSESERSAHSSGCSVSDISLEPPSLPLPSSSHSSESSSDNKHKQIKSKQKSKKVDRIGKKRQRGEVKKSRHGGYVDRAVAAEKLQQLGEREGTIAFLRDKLDELQAEKDEENKYCGFDPDEILTFRNDKGVVVMRPTSEGISVNEAYRKGAHLFGWIAEVASNEKEGTCFISVDKLMYMKNRYWSRATDVCKTSLLTSLVGEKWPYVSKFYLAPVDLERKAYDIIFNSSPDPNYSMAPTIRASSFPKTESEILQRLKVHDPNYLKDRRAYQLLPLDDTYMAYHFPICTDELEKMMCKRLTSKFNPGNWKSPDVNSPWFKLYGDGTWDIDFDPDSQFSFFRDYAEKIIKVKSTLSRAERQQWRNMADEIDKMGPREIVTKLKASIRAQTNCFIKNELYAKDSTTLRLIISPSLFVKIVFGAIIKRIEEKLYSGEAHIPISGHHIKHVPLSHAEALFCSWQSRGDGQFYETDYSAYESSQNETSLRTEFELYKSYYRPNSLASEILDTVLEQMLSGTVVVRNKYFSIRMPVMRWSGMPNTACGNLLMNYYNLVVNCGLNPDSDFLLEGDDGIIWGDLQLGRDLETKSAFPLTMQTSYDYTRLSFCGLHYEGDAHIPADENLAIAKLLTYFDSQELSMQKRYELLYLRLISYQLLYPKWPALNSIIQQAERFYHHSAYKQITESTIRRWFNEQGWWMSQMLGEFDISDMILPGGSYAFVHLCYENIDSVRRRSRNMVLSRSEREMDNLLPEFRQSSGSRILRKIGSVVATAGPAIGVALAMSGRRKQALAAVVASAAVSTVINECVPSESSDGLADNKSTSGFLDKIWGAAGQVLPALFSFKSVDLSLDRSKISKPQASVIACENGPASLSH